MIYESLISIVEKNKNVLNQKWRTEIKKNNYLTNYHTLSDEEIELRGEKLFDMFLTWLNRGAEIDEIQVYFKSIGSQRFLEGFPLSEINYGLYLEKSVLTSFVNEGVSNEEKFTSSEIIELMVILNSYFDLGSFFIIKGYMSEFANEIKTKLGPEGENIEDYLASGVLERESGHSLHKFNYSRK